MAAPSAKHRLIVYADRQTHAVPVPHCTSTQQRIPRPCGSLSAIAALSSADIWAVGANTNEGVQPQPLIEHWDGRQWRIVPSPTSCCPLTAITAISTRDVWAVGADIEHWDGQRWSSVPFLSKGGFSAITAISHSDVWAATGDGKNHPAFAHWDGTRWQSIPGPAVLGSVSGLAAASARDVWAIGNLYLNPASPRRVALHWDGTRWTTVPLPRVQPPHAVPPGLADLVTNDLTAITALSAHDIWAVGSYDAGNCCRAGAGPVALHYDGRRWSAVPVPNIPGSQQHDIAGVQLTGIAAVSSRDVWAVGMTATEHWDGTRWQLVPSPRGRLSTGATLVAVAAIASRDVWAVGQILNETALAHWNGVRWGLAPSPNTNV